MGRGFLYNNTDVILKLPTQIIILSIPLIISNNYLHLILIYYQVPRGNFLKRSKKEKYPNGMEAPLPPVAAKYLDIKLKKRHGILVLLYATDTKQDLGR